MKLNARNLLWLLLVMIVAIITSVIYYYNYIHADVWQEQRLAKQIAYEEIDLLYPEEVQRYNGEKSYHVVFGKNGHEQEMIVWIHDRQVTHYVYANEGLTKESLIEQFAKKHPDADLIHTTPGIKDGELVWEIFYKKKSEEGIRPYYDYYRFADGTWIDTYTLSLLR